MLNKIHLNFKVDKVLFHGDQIFLVHLRLSSQWGLTLKGKKAPLQQIFSFKHRLRRF